MGGHRFGVTGEALVETLDRMKWFKPYVFTPEAAEIASVDLPEFGFAEGKACEVPTFTQEQYAFLYEEVDSVFGTTVDGYLLRLTPEGEAPLSLWVSGERPYRLAYLYGNTSVRLLRFALWIGYGLLTAGMDTALVHSSCIVYERQAVLFLGESGTGKSTHTRLWREHIAGSELLNDDSPVVRVVQGRVCVYGSPWSGKTPCYKTASYPLAGCVRLSQASFNEIRRLDTLRSYAALHPSFPPEFAYDAYLYDRMSALLSVMVREVPVYHLKCLPDRAAAELVCETLFGGR